ncbi:MAG: TolC family protein [Lewinellaceae bacterium]|nr:TolC family protein [Phaeodactylibacter sp.]MCB9036180.1 TolC family protein [Lewinellaceae bacterium]
MMYLHKLFLLLGAILPLAAGLQAQAESLPATSEERNLEKDPFAVRPLEDLIEEALQYAPLLKIQEYNVENAHLRIKLLDKEWSSYFNSIGSFQLGNIRYLDNLNSDNGVDVRTITRENTFYGLGIQVRLPLSDFVTRNDRRAVLHNQLEQEKLMRQEQQIKIRELVIRQYQELQLKLNMIGIKSRNLDFHAVFAEMAEKYFREGNLSLEEYTRAANGRNQAEEALALAKAEATVAFQLLREIVGTDIRSK